MKKLLLLFLMLNIYTCICQESDGFLYQIKGNNGFGLIDNLGNVIVEPEFFQVGEFKEGLAYFEIYKKGIGHHLAGYVNLNGEISVEPVFVSNNNLSRQFSEGLAVVKDKNYSCGYINKQGEMIIAPKYSHAHEFKEGYAVVQLNGEKILINKKGEVVLNPKKIMLDAHGLKINKRRGEYIAISNHVKEGLISFKINKDNYPIRTGVFNTKGKLIFKLKEFSQIHEFNNGIALAISKDNKKAGYINKYGKIIIPFKFSKATNFTNGYAKVQDANTKKYGIINEKGEYVIKPEYTFISDKYYSNEFIVACKTVGKCGYLDIQGNVTIDLKYYSVGDFSEGIAMVYDRIKKDVFYINKKNEKVIELDFDINYSQYGSVFENGLAKVKLKGVGTVYINKKGEIIYKFNK
ncbi:WG repeat-containing protein [uncultured Kordia sp.]|uniref:WG repeat-containing protein n=1 Tax=uncultured Kordia sp. TaxID=507699 RepID=UPI002626C9C8|nr:WG repeat-containing protein [uncultured Kordia sp.]